MSESETRLFLADDDDRSEDVRDKLEEHLSDLTVRKFLVELTKLRAQKLLDTGLANNQDTMSLILCGTDFQQIMVTRRWVTNVVLPAIMAVVDELEAEEQAKSKEGGANESSEQGSSGEATAPLHQPDDDEGGSEAGQ